MPRFCMFKAVASLIILVFIVTFVALVIVRSLERNDTVTCSNFLKQKRFISINDQKCLNVKTVIKRSDSDYPDIDKNIERQISTSKDMNGILPIHYNWKTILNNQTDFEGEVSIIIFVTIETNAIRINVDFEKIQIIVNSISLFRCSNILEYVCPEEIYEDRVNQILVLNFNRTLKVEVPYVLRFGRYFGAINEGDTGLIIRYQSKNSWAVTSFFQMRHARMAYPCFDHPILKATFDICVSHSLDTVARSNMEVESTEYKQVGSMKMVCFKRTPKISTYISAIAILANFTEVVNTEDNPKIELYFSNELELSWNKWQINETRQILKFIKETFNLSYDLSKLGIINVYNHPRTAIENIGLITVSGDLMKPDRSASYRILTHEIVHHWIGNIVTIKGWEEICVQEGFTSYLTELIVKHLHPIEDYYSSIDFKYMRRIRLLYSDATIPLINIYNTTNDDRCYLVPITYFQMITYRNDLWTIFLKTLVKKYSFSNADLNDWGLILNEKTNNINISKSLISAFNSAGYPVIYGRMSSNSTLNIHQKTFLNLDKPLLSETREVPLQISSGSYLSEMIIVDETNQTVDIGKMFPEKWFMMDPSFNVFGRKYYSPENYLSLIDCFWNEQQNSCQITIQQFNEIFVDFCDGIIQNFLPWETESNLDELFLWKRVLEKLFQLKKQKLWSTGNYFVDWQCVCCIKNKTDIATFETQMCPYRIYGFQKEDCICSGCGRLRICSTKTFFCDPNKSVASGK